VLVARTVKAFVHSQCVVSQPLMQLISASMSASRQTPLMSSQSFSIDLSQVQLPPAVQV
jgi:hypothetical protein